MEYRTFMNTYRSYLGLTERIEDLDTKIELLVYEMEGVKGVRFDRTPSVPDPHQAEEKMLELIEQKAELEKEREILNKAVDNVKAIIDKEFRHISKDATLVIVRNAAGESLEKLSEEYGYTPSGLWRYIKREVENES